MDISATERQKQAAVPHMRVPDAFTHAELARVFEKSQSNLKFFDFLWDNKIKIAFSIFAGFFVIYTLVAFLGFLPESLLPESNTPPVVAIGVMSAQVNTPPDIFAPTSTPVAPQLIVPKTTSASAESPIRIRIDSIGVDAKVSNPKTTNIDVLDEYLQSGAVRYPGSAALGEGNTYIFGHSTNHPVVINQAYKTFNDFDKLAIGDLITVESLDRSYTYKVERVRKTTASEAFVDFSIRTPMLTLSTCDTFAAKADRWVVEASFVNSQPLNN